MSPVRQDVWRRRKYAVKIEPEPVRLRFEGLGPSMKEQTDMRFAELAKFEDDVKSILEEAGIQTILVPFYLNYARELYRRKRRFTGATLRAEAELLQSKWVARGLNATILESIKRYFAIPGYVY